MEQEVYILTDDRVFGQYIRLTLLGHIPGVTLLSPAAPLPVGGLVIVDLDTVPMPHGYEGRLLLTSTYEDKPRHWTGLWLDRPFSQNRLLSVLGLEKDQKSIPLYPLTDRKSVMVDGEEIPLTQREYDLFTVLFHQMGKYVKREDILKAVWGDTTDDVTVVNVYIHYLREKIEKKGHIYLYSKRGEGYALTQGEASC